MKNVTIRASIPAHVLTYPEAKLVHFLIGKYSPSKMERMGMTQKEIDIVQKLHFALDAEGYGSWHSGKA